MMYPNEKKMLCHYGNGRGPVSSCRWNPEFLRKSSRSYLHTLNKYAYIENWEAQTLILVLTWYYLLLPHHPSNKKPYWFYFRNSFHIALLCILTAVGLVKACLYFLFLNHFHSNPICLLPSSLSAFLHPQHSHSNIWWLYSLCGSDRTLGRRWQYHRGVQNA